MGVILGAIKIIFLLGLLITIHELGHFLVAKKCKVKVLEFSIGFGKEIWSKQGKETKYSIRMIPLGGFCNMLGEEENSEEEGSFSNSPIWKRFLIVIAGATVNIIFGLLVLFILASIVNLSIKKGIIVIGKYIALYAEGIASLFKTGVNMTEVVGPVGISEMIVQTNGIVDFVYLLSVISISLGITNLLPIPGLDGGKILLLIIELIRGKKLNQITEAVITSVGLLILLTIAVIVTGKDISKLF